MWQFIDSFLGLLIAYRGRTIGPKMNTDKALIMDLVSLHIDVLWAICERLEIHDAVHLRATCSALGVINILQFDREYEVYYCGDKCHLYMRYTVPTIASKVPTSIRVVRPCVYDIVRYVDTRVSGKYTVWRLWGVDLLFDTYMYVTNDVVKCMIIVRPGGNLPLYYGAPMKPHDFIIRAHTETVDESPLELVIPDGWLLNITDHEMLCSARALDIVDGVKLA